jgi:hypothetical protein
MAVTDIPGSRHGYKSEPGTLPWLREHYVFVKSLPQGNEGTFDLWIAKQRFDAVARPGTTAAALPCDCR